MPVGFVGLPSKRDMKIGRATLARTVGALPPTPLQRSQGVGLFSNILLRAATAAHDRFTRLSFVRALLPVDRDPSTTGGGPSIGAGTPPIYLGSAFGMLDHHRLKMVRFVMNPKFGPKTRPC